MMVTMLHALGKSNLLGNLVGDTSAVTFLSWIFEALSISAVNIFMLISGYFLIKSEFKISRFIELIAQMLFYTLGAFLVCLAFGIVGKEEIGTYWFLNYLLPVHMEVFWFMTAYIVLYALLPIISKGIQAVTKKQFLIVIIILLIYECGIKSFLPFKVYTDSRGYSFLWCLIVFMIGAYLRLYGFKILNSAGKGAALYFGAVAIVFAEAFVIQFANIRFGRLLEIASLATDYNNIFVLAAAVGIFAAFMHGKQIEGTAAKVITFISPLTLGVYLFQENMTLRFRWQQWFKLTDESIYELPKFIVRILLAVIVMFVIGIAADFVRSLIFGGVKQIFKKGKKKDQ